ncbi:MAG: ribosome small subunit-dependent GTPase A [Phycisphaerae bacterium]|nr:ribosome small subunit-dependent GTPase A [Phycisphaerae bacterium]
MAKKRPGRKMRVDFRQNRQVRGRTDDWTRSWRAGEQQVEETQRRESVRAKGELSRKRTILVDAQDMPTVDEALWRRGTVTKVHGLIAYVNDEQGRNWECTVRRVLRTLLIAHRAPVSVGDRVWFSDQSQVTDGRAAGVIERVAPRSSELSRRDARRRQHTIVANADQLLAVVSVAQPRLRPHLVDRYIVAAMKGALRPILCFNKIDLLERDEQTDDDDAPQNGASVQDVIAEFRALGYCCLCTSAVTGAGVEDLRAALTGHMTVLSGQSGVGKSSLINKLQPGLDLATRDVSDENEKGRHTTSLAELLPLKCGGFVVDTPGIRAFDLWSVAPGELEACFIEFVPHVSHCRFSDCAHRTEDGCAVRAAVERGEISQRRYYSYLKMLEEV